MVIASELHMEDRAVDTSKIDFSVNKVLAERFFDNLSNDILNHHSKLLAKVHRKWLFQFQIVQFSILGGLAK